MQEGCLVWRVGGGDCAARFGTLQTPEGRTPGGSEDPPLLRPLLRSGETDYNGAEQCLRTERDGASTGICDVPFL